MRARTLALALAWTLPAASAPADDEQADDERAEDEDADAEPAEPETEDEAPGRKEKKAQERAEPAEEDPDVEARVSGRVVLAHDVTPPRVILAGELLGAMPVDGGNRDLFGMGGGAALGVDVYLSPFLGLHAGGSFLYLGKNEGMSSTSWFGGHAGMRVHLAAALLGEATRHDAWFDVHVGYGSSGGIRRPGFDAGAAMQWEVSPRIRLGPMLRYQFGFDPREAHAHLITLGVAIGFGGRGRFPVHVEGDRDGDGFTDRADRCPDEVPGAKPDPERDGCPKIDRDGDGDGVADAEDACPEQVAGADPDPVRVGCPRADRDNDGIGDEADKCPDQPGPSQFGEPTHGCPLARVAGSKIEILQQIFFETDSATIKDESFPVLEAVAAILRDLGDARVRIEGHTDYQGTDQYNLDLSRRRARAVAQWLIETGKIKASRLETEGYGKSRPLVSGRNADVGLNRRVEFVLLDAP